MVEGLRNPRLSGFGATVFAEMSALAVKTAAVNLGQGFPDTDGPREVAEVAARAVVGVSALPKGAQVEMEAIMVLGTTAPSD